MGPQVRRLSPEARGMVPWCVALSVAVHVLLLAAGMPSGPRVAHPVSRARTAPVPIRLSLLAAAEVRRDEAQAPDLNPMSALAANPSVASPAPGESNAPSEPAAAMPAAGTLPPSSVSAPATAAVESARAP